MTTPAIAAETNSCYFETIGNGFKKFGSAFMPYPALPTDNKIAHYVLETFLILLKVGLTVASIVFTVQYGIAFVAPLTIAVTGVFLMMFSKKIASFLPENMQPTTRKFLEGLGSLTTACGSVLSVPVTWLHISAMIFMIARLNIDTLVLGKKGQHLEAQKLKDNLDAAMQSERPLRTVSFINEGTPFEITQDLLFGLIQKMPFEISFVGCIVEEVALQALNEKISDLLKTKNSDAKIYYHIVKDNQEGLTLKKSSTDPFELIC